MDRLGLALTNFQERERAAVAVSFAASGGSTQSKHTAAIQLSGEVSLGVLSGGLGFHSNDARGTTIRVDPATGDPASRVDPLVRSPGAELGFRANPMPSWRSTLALWALDLDSELLFSGITLANSYRPVPQLSLDADVSFARARFSGVPAGDDHIPGALENVVADGVTWAPRRNIRSSEGR